MFIMTLGDQKLSVILSGESTAEESCSKKNLPQDSAVKGNALNNKAGQSLLFWSFREQRQREADNCNYLQLPFASIPICKGLTQKANLM